jgi:Kinesin motor domain
MADLKCMKPSISEILDTSAAINKGILVAVRIRPLSSKELDAGEQSCCELLDKTNIVTITQAGIVGSYLKSQAGTVNDYAFDAVFDSSASQMDVYRRTAKPFIPKVLAGLNVTVFAYGATSAGKTHTMFGSSRADEAASHGEAGIIPNAVRDVFDLIDDRKTNLISGEKWRVNVSYIEVYNEQIYDLLVPSPTGKFLSLREDQEKGIVKVAGVIEQEVMTLDEVLKLLALGNKNRKTEATLANQVSSRSHAILQLTVIHSIRIGTGKDSVAESKLSLIDLAGSERASATNNRGARLMEGANINKSLLALANCINALAENSGNGKKGNVKYRDSKLTLLLKNSLEGRANLVIIANINPSHVTLEDSHNTLKYANRAKNIKVNPLLKEIPKELSWAEREVKLREENQSLKERVALLESIVEDLRASIRESGGDNAMAGWDNSTAPGWNDISRSSHNSHNPSIVDGDVKDSDRLSNSFSSSISSYSDMADYPFASEYEALRTATSTATSSAAIEGEHDTTDHLLNLSIENEECNMFDIRTITERNRDENENDNPFAALLFPSQPEHLTVKGVTSPVGYTVPSQPLSMKRSRHTYEDALELEVEGDNQPREPFAEHSKVLSGLFSSPKARYRSTRAKIHTLVASTCAVSNSKVAAAPASTTSAVTAQANVCAFPSTSASASVHESDLTPRKKRRMSSIPMLARASTRSKVDAVVSKECPAKHDTVPCQPVTVIPTAPQSQSIMMTKSPLCDLNTKKQSPALHVACASVFVEDNNTPLTQGTQARKPRRAQSLGSRRRSLEMDAVNAMLAALPEHLQSLPKGTQKRVIDSNDNIMIGEKESRDIGSNDDNQAYDVMQINDENNFKPPASRRSLRTKQNTSKITKIRLTPIAEEPVKQSPIYDRESVAISDISLPRNTRRSSVAKCNAFLKKKDTPPLPSVDCIHSDTWMLI